MQKTPAVLEQGAKSEIIIFQKYLWLVLMPFGGEVSFNCREKFFVCLILGKEGHNWIIWPDKFQNNTTTRQAFN